MATQTVFRLDPKKGFDGLEAYIEPIPTIRSHEILVKIRSVGLNGRDIAILNGTYPLPVKDQLVPFSDMAGEVVQVGDEVTDFSVGDLATAPLYFSFLYGQLQPKDAGESSGGMKDGMLREYVALQSHVAVKLPKSQHSFTQWAALIQSGSTVWNALYGNKPLKPGDTVLLQGTGGISLVALIFAKAAGATTIITSSSDEKLAHVKSKYGADHTINYRKYPDWAAEVQQITNGRGVDHVLEIGGSGTMQQSLNSVARGGLISVVGFLTSVSQDEMPDVTMGTLHKGCIVRGVQSGSKEQLEEAVRFMGTRNLQMPVEKVYGFTKSEILAALRHVASPQLVGKVCIEIS